MDKIFDIIASELTDFQPISLEEMSNIKLMDRIDSKFVLPVDLLQNILQDSKDFFKVQQIDNLRIASYSTQYLDTVNFDYFIMHQNRKLNRQKIRIRNYIDSNLSFLEIKNKNNKGRTKKKRVVTNFSNIDNIDNFNEELAFLEEHSIFAPEKLIPVLKNNFNRITLVNNKETERVTIDLDLSFFNMKTEIATTLDKLAIIELKQDGMQHSDFLDILLKYRVKKSAFSKYCIGIALTMPNIKSNRFKRKIKYINKLTQQLQ